jgi:hypothetical protein
MLASAEIILVPLISMALWKSVAVSRQTAIFVLHPTATGIAEIIGGTAGSLLVGTPTFGIYCLILTFSFLNVFQFIAARRVAILTKRSAAQAGHRQYVRRGRSVLLYC